METACSRSPNELATPNWFNTPLLNTLSLLLRHPHRAQRLKQAHAQKVSPSGRFSGHTASGRTISGRPTNAGQAHGHKGDLLFRALPEIEAEAQ